MQPQAGGLDKRKAAVAEVFRWNWSAGVSERWAAATPHHSSTPMDTEPKDGSKPGRPWVDGGFKQISCLGQRKKPS